MTPRQNIHFLAQAEDLCATLDAEVFAAREGGRAPIGAHLRHVIDYYRCFFAGLENGDVDYDARQRDRRLEADPAYAAVTVREIAEKLSELEGADRERELRIKVDAFDFSGRPDAEVVWSRSTLGRELQFLVSHTVHHFALIGFLMRQHGLEVDDGFGVAPSTLEYRRQEQTACVR